MKVPFILRLFSYFYPVRISKAGGKTTPLLGLYRYRGRWQLGAATALYSDGHRYRPLRQAFRAIRPQLPETKRMLVLGAGLGSALYVLDHMHIPLPSTTLVDIDAQVIDWARQLLPGRLSGPVSWLCADARAFAASAGSGCCDLLIVDIFQDRHVPAFVTTDDFLQHCSRLLDQHGLLVLNYIINNTALWEQAEARIRQHFDVREILSMDINRVIIARPKIV